MASSASDAKSDSDTDNSSCSAFEVTTSEERVFREMASVEYQSEGDQFEEGKSRDKGDQMKDSRMQTAQLSLVDDEASAVLSHSVPDSDGENEEDLDLKTSEVAATDLCLQEMRPQIDQTTTSSWKKLIASTNKQTKKKSALYICLTYCKYDSVHRVGKRFGFKEVMEYDDWNLFWTDGCVTLSRMMEMKKFQKINHFPGMSEICRKDLLARNMNRMLKSFPKEYNIFPRTWCLPADHADFQLHARRRKHRTYIIKPESSCQGRGIWLTRKTKEVSPVERLICQVYISKPFLIDRLKFDLRIYVLVTSVDPFRIYVFKDGLARFATAKYVEPTKNNVANIYMHLTNYAINKVHYHYSVDDEAGSKRRISTVIRWLERNNYDVKRLWADIDDVIFKTLISAHGTLRQNYRSCFLNHEQITACFDILGFDILLDHKLKPYLLEVNHSPSFHTDTDLDKEIKETLLYDTLCLVNFDAVDRRQCIEEEKRKIMTRLTTGRKATDPNSGRDNLGKLQEKYNDEQLQYEQTHIGNFRRIYPLEGTDRYDKYFCTNSSIYQETATFKAHTRCARLQREQILRRKEELDILQRKKKDPALRPESPDVKKPNTKQRIPEIANAVNVPAQMPKTCFPEKIVIKEEMDRINDLIEREVLIHTMGVVQFIQNMFSQSFENISTTIEAPSSYTSKVPETLKVVAASGAEETEPNNVSEADAGKVFEQPVESEPVLSDVHAQPACPSNPPPRFSSDFSTVHTSSCSLSTPSQSAEENTDSSLSSRMPPCGLCVSTATCEASGMRSIKLLPDTITYSKHSISRSLKPVLKQSPTSMGRNTVCCRHYERLPATLPNQRELRMMLNLCRNPAINHSGPWNWPDMKVSLTRSQTLSNSADETGSQEKLKSNKNVLAYQERKQLKVAAKLDDNLFNNNKWLEISKLDLHKQFKPK